MNKADLIDAVAAKCGFSKKDTEKAVSAFFATVEEALIEGEKVQLTGFGVFEVREHQARTGRNPQTGATIQIAASLVPAFRAGTALKEAVR